MLYGGAKLKSLSKYVNIIGALVVIMGNFAFPTFVSAQGGSPGQGLEISPPVIELKADPGQNVQAIIRVRNVTNLELIARPQANDFGAEGEEGQPKLFINPGEASPLGIKDWITSLPDTRIAKHELKAIAFTISVPKNASPGGHYGVIRFTAIAPDIDTTGVALSASIGSLVLVNVSGNAVEKAQVASLIVEHAGKPGGFFENGPLSFVERIQNQGTVHVKPIGNLTIYDTFHRKVAVLEVNKDAHNVLPDSVRRFDQTLPNKFMFGMYTATLNLSYGSKGGTLIKSVSFWVIPWKLILLVLVILAILFIIVRRSIKSYNRRLIERYKRHNR